jgi:hypothetical protein
MAFTKQALDKLPPLIDTLISAIRNGELRRAVSSGGEIRAGVKGAESGFIGDGKGAEGFALLPSVQRIPS